MPVRAKVEVMTPDEQIADLKRKLAEAQDIYKHIQKENDDLRILIGQSDTRLAAAKEESKRLRLLNQEWNMQAVRLVLEKETAAIQDRDRLRAGIEGLHLKWITASAFWPDEPNPYQGCADALKALLSSSEEGK